MRCRHCHADLTTPAQRSFNESFWRKRTEEEAEQAREVEALRLRLREAEREDAAALRQLMELERQWTIRRTFGLPWDERHGIVRVVGAGGRWAGEAFGGWLWHTFPRRSTRVLFMVALCLGLVGLLYALLPARLLPWVLAGAAVPTLLAWVRERFRGRE